MKRSDAQLREAILEGFESLMRHVGSGHAAEFLEIDVTMSQAKVLYMVSVQPDTNMSWVAAQLQVGLSVVSGIVDRLVEHGYLIRYEDAADRRQHLLRLSPHGALVVERIRDLNTNQMHRLMTALSSAELEALETGVAALAREARELNETSSGGARPGTERNPA